MTQKRTKRVKRSKQRRKEGRVRFFFWFFLILLLIPVGIFGWLILSAWLDTGSPILGNRYEGDLDPAITKANLDEIESLTKSVNGVEKAQVHLSTATLRVYADINDSASIETAQSTAESVYAKVVSVLDPNVYFTKHDGKKMYDVEVHVYNKENNDDESMVYVIETKTSSMESPRVQVVSEPIDAELAQQLRDNVENRNKPTPVPEETNEITVGGEDVEPSGEEETGEQG